MRRPLCSPLAVGRVSLAVAFLAACVPAGEPPSRAHQPGLTEPRGAEVTPTRYLRQLSLDLRGAPPSPEEYRRVAAEGAVPDAVVDGMLRDPRFITRVKRWHADLLWPSMAGFEFFVGARLAVVPGRNRDLGVDRINPEWLVEAMDRRTDEPACPAAGTPEHLTAASCCTAADPNHPACCLVRNRAYDPDDPACVAKSAALPAVFDYGIADGDQYLRGGPLTYMGCDNDLEYPPPRVAADDRRWPHDAGGRPYYTSPRSGRRRYYYDELEIPLPYDDVVHCPDYCRAPSPSGPGERWVATDFAPKQRVVDGQIRHGDGPGFACPAGFVEVANPCDNALEARRPMRGAEMRQEGWRLTRPWWARGHWVKTCAYEAQERAESPHTRLPCRRGVTADNACGCGPQGARCAPFTGDVTRLTASVQRVLDAINQEPLEIVGSVVERDEDYATVLTTRRGVANGPLAFLNRHQTDHVGELDFSPSAPPEDLPDVPPDDPTWRPYLRHEGHAGVLTTPVFLARFGTLRARIDRFRTAFLCRPFVPSADPAPPAEDACNRESNLARRCGCQHCHASIEPLGAAWGRWAERSTVFLDPAQHPPFDPVCATCAATGCPRRCRDYVTAPLDGNAAAFLGTLQAYLYRGPEEVRRIEAGPRSLVDDALLSGELQSCAARTAWARLVHRPMSEGELARVLPALVRDFEASGRSYRALVRAIVTSAAYRWID
ncbi:MAG: hypothetical protein U0324_01375 [Polyangiales bacterium]